MAPGPSLAPAPAPDLGGTHHKFDGESQVKDFIHTLLHYGGYNELVDILVNLTSLPSEMGNLVSEGYVLIVLAPNDNYSPETFLSINLVKCPLTHPDNSSFLFRFPFLIPEYQTEESMYNAVRKFGKIRHDTLRVPHKVVAEEADGSVKFGQGDESAYLMDPDIYTDGRISVQGSDGVLFPTEEKPKSETKLVQHSSTTKSTVKPRREIVRFRRRDSGAGGDHLLVFRFVDESWSWNRGGGGGEGSGGDGGGGGAVGGGGGGGDGGGGGGGVGGWGGKIWVF
ncbi:fasciclin-like arabinogalactan protein 17 [Telopea speciosissima]|uniref:fasciclin-like arabinogalactan protein 17 n=1 Tax=Telopea speciosissima TaxID=54955 RepID=UPI001CC6C3CC|nr:fasciclin-like arabinogalactan protein 17 [Telopea speciosissima]